MKRKSKIVWKKRRVLRNVPPPPSERFDCASGQWKTQSAKISTDSSTMEDSTDSSTISESSASSTVSNRRRFVPALIITHRVKWGDVVCLEYGVVDKNYFFKWVTFRWRYQVSARLVVAYHEHEYVEELRRDCRRRAFVSKQPINRKQLHFLKRQIKLFY